MDSKELYLKYIAHLIRVYKLDKKQSTALKDIFMHRIRGLAWERIERLHLLNKIPYWMVSHNVMGFLCVDQSILPSRLVKEVIAGKLKDITVINFADGKSKIQYVGVVSYE